MNEGLELIRGGGNVFAAWPLAPSVVPVAGAGWLLPEASALVAHSEGRKEGI